MAGTRTEKLNSEFQKSIYEILTKKVKDVRLTEMFTILQVDTDKELQTAKVLVSIFSTDKEKADLTFQAICDASGFIRQTLSKTMHIRTVPKFEFVLDTSMQYSQRINDILSEINKK
jgi:ribosome-binding factor A